MSIINKIIGGGGGGSGLSEAQVDARVVVVASGKKSIWVPVKDMFAASLQAPGALADVGTSSGGNAVMRVRPFDASSVEILFFNFTVPASMDLTTAFSLSVYWAPTNTNTGDVRWRFVGRAFNDGDAIVQPLESTVTIDDTANGTADDVHITSEGAMSAVLTGIASGSTISFQIARLATADTYNADANLIGLMLHYVTDAPTDD